MNAPAAPRLWPIGALPFAIAFLSPLLPLLIVFGGTLPASAPRADMSLLISVVCLLVAASALSLVGLIQARFQGFPKLLIAPLAAVILTELVAAAMGLDFKAGLFSIACQLGGILMLAAGIIVFADTRARRWFIGCYLVAGITAALFAIALSVMRQPPAMFAYEHGRASGTFLQPNEFAGYLLFLIPLAVGQSVAPRPLRVLGWVAAAVGLAGLIFSVSRAAVVALAIGMLFFMRMFNRRAQLAYAALSFCVLLVMALGFRDVAHDPSENASRIAVWSSALRLVQRFGLTGTGPLGFHLVYPQLKLPDIAVDEVHAHDLPLQLLIENGVLGLAAAGWLVAAAVVAARRTRTLIPPEDREKLVLFAAITAGFAASALQNTVDVVTTFLLISSWPALTLMLSLGANGRQPLLARCSG